MVDEDDIAALELDLAGDPSVVEWSAQRVHQDGSIHLKFTVLEANEPRKYDDLGRLVRYLIVQGHRQHITGKPRVIGKCKHGFCRSPLAFEESAVVVLLTDTPFYPRSCSCNTYGWSTNPARRGATVSASKPVRLTDPRHARLPKLRTLAASSALENAIEEHREYDY